MEDGAGIVVLSLEVQSLPSETDHSDDDRAASEEEDVTWDFVTACFSIEPFHKAARFALEHESQVLLESVHQHFASWAKNTLSWLPRQPCPPTHNSICGYRVAMCEDVPLEGTDAESDAGAKYASRKVFLYDFTPARVEAATDGKNSGRMSNSPSSTTASSHKAPQSWATQPLDGGMDQLEQTNPNPVERFAVLRLTPCVEPQELADALRKYVTESPYIVCSRNISLSTAGSFYVVHLTYDRLLFAQVRASHWI